MPRHKNVSGESIGLTLVHWCDLVVCVPRSLRAISARIANAIAQQIRREPDVLDCSVRASVTRPGMVDIEARAQILVFGSTIVRQAVAF